MKRIVVLLSGGVESLVVSALLRSSIPDALVHAVHVRYGQRAQEQEQAAVTQIAREYGMNVEYVDLDLPFLSQHFLVRPNFVVYSESDESKLKADELTNHIVPQRNLVFLSICASFAETVGATEIWTGFDFEGRSSSARDKRPEFVDLFNQTIAESGGGGLRVVAPLQGNTKTQTAAVGESLRVNWKMSWSCYNDLPKHCGMCGSCRARRKALRETEQESDDVAYCSEEYVRELFEV